MTNQEGKIKRWAELAVIEPQGYEQTFHLFCDAASVAAGNTNERMYTVFKFLSGSTETTLNGVLNDFAVSKGAPNWNSLGYYT